MKMAKITKQLKHAEFQYDEETKEFRVQDDEGNEVVQKKLCVRIDAFCDSHGSKKLVAKQQIN